MKKEEMQAQPFAKLWGYESDYYRFPPLKNNLRYGMLNGRPDALSMLNEFFKTTGKELTEKFMSSIHKNLEFGNVLCCWHDGRLVGMCNVYCNNEDTKEAYCCNVEVLKEYRGHHIGRHLMKDAARLVEDRQFRSIRLTVDETNTIARHLYDTEGFILTGNKTFEGDKTLLEMRKHI